MKDHVAEGFLRGSDAAVAEAIARWSPRLLALASTYTPDQDEAHDIVQECWVRAFERRTQYSGRGSFPGWLMTICRNIALSRARRTPRSRPEGAGRESTVPPPDIGLQTRALRRAVLDAVLSLPERQRETVILRMLEGLSTRETATRLGCAEGTVKAALHAALTRLHPMLEEWSP